MTLLLGLLILSATVYAIVRRLDVRLALFVAALALAGLGGDISPVVRTFLATFSNEQFVVPICTAMGFAHVLQLTKCDQHLVRLLVRPLQRVRVFLIPGAVLVGFVVNIPIISQTSTSVAIGPVLVPLMLAAHISPLTIGAALLLGASIGGELLNSGAPELRTVSNALGVEAGKCAESILPLILIQLTVTTCVFWILSLRAERATKSTREVTETDPAHQDFRVNYLKAIVPLLPVVLLFLTAGPRYLVPIPHRWLVDVTRPGEDRYFDGRLIGAAMLVGVVVAALTSRKELRNSARAFFEGAGYAFTHIISLIVTAQCFGEAVKGLGLADFVGTLTNAWPALLVPSAGLLPLAFAWLSGSGMAATQSLFSFFTEPSAQLGFDAVRVGAVVSIGAAAGRTMSPVSAVSQMCGTLTETSALALCKRVAVPLLIGLGAVIIVGQLLASQ